mgnify:CR=1 FL=1
MKKPMDNIFYLLNMSLSGIKNIEKEIKIDFFGKSVSKDFNPAKYKIKGIYGENGVGKSAIVTAVDIVKKFVVMDNYLRDYQSQLLLRELINKNTRKFTFKCEFVSRIGAMFIYTYEVCFIIGDDDEIYVSHESLKYRQNSSKNKTATIFNNDDGKLTVLISEGIEREAILDKTRNLLGKQSALSLMIDAVIGDEKNSELLILLTCAMVFFFMLITHFDREDIHEEYYRHIKLSNLKKDTPSIEKVLEEIETTITSGSKRIAKEAYVEYQKKVKKLEKFIRLFKPELRSIEIDKKENKESYECRLIMDYGSYRVDREFESTGIKKLMSLFDTMLLASRGAIVFIDEIDSNINDVYLCRLLEYFKYYGKGQICFTSHNLDPMTVLKENSKSIDFLTSDNKIVPWVKNGHYTPDNSFRNGLIAGMPFNIDSTDFIRVFEGEN